MKRIVLVVFLGLMIGLMGVSQTFAYDVSGSFIDRFGTSRNYSDYDGNYVFLEAFATDCSHCINQHPILSQLFSEYGSDIVFLSIAVWNTKDTVSTINDFVDSHPTSWTIGVDSGNLANQLGVTGTPTMFILDDGGVVKERIEGERDYEFLKNYLEVYGRDNTDVTIPSANTAPSGSNNNSIFGIILESPIFQLSAGVILVFMIYIRSIKK